MTLTDLFNASCDIHPDTVFWVYDSVGDFYNYHKSLPLFITKYEMNNHEYHETTGRMKIRRFKIDTERNICFVLMA